jgi:hypothetical protein
VYLTKEQVESFPPYDEEAIESPGRWGMYENQYRSAWPATPAGETGERGKRWSSFEQSCAGIGSGSLPTRLGESGKSASLP